MPTAAKLVAAISFGALAWITCSVLDGFIRGTQPIGHMYEIALLCGVLTGWFVSGSARRTSYAEAAATGLRTAMTAVFATLLALAIGTMWTDATRGRYRGPMDAVLDVFDIMLEFGLLLRPVVVLGTVILGGMIAGLATEWAGRRWR